MKNLSIYTTHGFINIDKTRFRGIVSSENHYIDIDYDESTEQNPYRLYFFTTEQKEVATKSLNKILDSSGIKKINTSLILSILGILSMATLIITEILTLLTR